MTDPLRPAWQRLLLGVGFTLLAALTLVVGLQLGVLLAAALGGGDLSSVAESVQDGGSSRSALAALVVGEMAVVVLAGVVGSTTLGWRAFGLGLAGTGRALRLCLPLLVVVVGLPLVATVASGDPLVAEGIDGSRAALLVAFAAAIGVAEELAFRGVLLEVLGGRAAAAFSVGVSAALFAALHVGNGPATNAIAVALVVGIPFALVRFAGGSLLGLAIVHALIDTFALLQFGGARVPRDTATAEQAAQVVMAVLVCAGYVLWYRLRVSRSGA